MMNLAGCNRFGSMGLMGGGLLFYGIIILLIVILGFYLFNNRQNAHHQSSALEILDREYAQGKISEEDYAKRKNNLRK